MFWFRDTRPATPSAPAASGRRVEVAFTDGSVDLRGVREGFPEHLARVTDACGVTFARLNQVHGDRVVVVEEPWEHGPRETDEVPEADALLTTRPGVGLMVRAADCVPLVLADPAAGVLAVVHSGRVGTVLDVTTRALEAMAAHGATAVTAWIGPHVCGGCYEVPAAMRDEVVARVPATAARTMWGTPALDLGAGVRAQLQAADVVTEVVDAGGCTREEPRLPSHRRDAAAAGRLAGLVWLA